MMMGKGLKETHVIISREERGMLMLFLSLFSWVLLFARFAEDGREWGFLLKGI